ncbi:MAG TPA: hypothetical protein VGS57_14405 [Thermoanaerobaculia bacterium]|jgi:hypothetical protein|nr:hypothetical protein [Thermoanaerobaculia bacterium]
MTAFRIAVWIALALGGLGLGTGLGTGAVQPKKGCSIDPNGGPTCTNSTGEIVWADEGSSIDPNGR